MGLVGEEKVRAAILKHPPPPALPVEPSCTGNVITSLTAQANKLRRTEGAFSKDRVTLYASAAAYLCQSEQEPRPTWKALLHISLEKK